MVGPAGSGPTGVESLRAPGAAVAPTAKNAIIAARNTRGRSDVGVRVIQISFSSCGYQAARGITGAAAWTGLLRVVHSLTRTRARPAPSGRRRGAPPPDESIRAPHRTAGDS